MVRTTSTGRVQFRVFLPHASRVEVVGDFTDWRAAAAPMARQGAGWWEAELDLSRGEHTFCYLVDGSIWLADYAAHGVRLSSYGGWVSQLQVGTPTPTTPKKAAGLTLAA